MKRGERPGDDQSNSGHAARIARTAANTGFFGGAGLNAKTNGGPEAAAGVGEVEVQPITTVNCE